MKTMKTMYGTTGAAACAAVTLLCVTNAQADWACEKGFRDTTQAERDMITTNLENAKHAMPPAPEGWVIPDGGPVKAMMQICRDGEPAPWTYSYTVYYQRIDDQEARNQMLQAAGEERMADIQAKQPRLDALMARNAALTQQLIDASEKGDFARAEAIGVEMEKISQEFEAILSEGGAEERMQAAEVAAGRDQSMTISIVVNSTTESKISEAEPFAVRQATDAYRWSSASDGSTEEHANILLGQWQRNESGYMQTVPRPGVSEAAAHTISLRITADHSRLDSMIGAIDFDSLMASLAR